MGGWHRSWWWFPAAVEVVEGVVPVEWEDDEVFFIIGVRFLLSVVLLYTLGSRIL
ncbi:hypothetical protein ACGE24_05145 [Corynebacterium kroppenstedtii]|uniref:hypothetical protein n=1 Tax=Corynebacterium sp. PCR 32 TaxID=3351342 RepID=UPI0030AB9ADC